MATQASQCQMSVFFRVGLRKCSPVKYSLNGSDLPGTTATIDLGVKMNSSLLFSDHIDYIVSKAKLRAGQILRCFVSKDAGILTRAFVMYV